jgi:RND family efflux transporter MFP subunit
MHATQSPRFWQKAAKPALAALIVLSLILIVTAIVFVLPDLNDSRPTLVKYTVSLSDLPIVVTERGNLESQVETTIRCEVENVSYDRSGSPGTQIIFIVSNGSAVKEGDLLVELDSASIRDKLDQQELAYERAKSQQIQASARYENQMTQNVTAEAQAKLDVELAKLNFKMYTDPDSGEFKLAMEAIERNIDEARSSILESQAALELAKTDKTGIEALFKLGYRGKSDLDKSRIDFMKAEDSLSSSVNRLNNHIAARLQLQTYEQEMQRLTLDGDVATAKRNLKQVVTDNESQLAQAKAAKIETERSDAKEHERLEKLKLQVGRCKIFAPHDGMVVYARQRSRYSTGGEIAEGVTVRQRQELITLPDLSHMQVKTQIHEAVLDQVKQGLPVTVRIDAFPNRTYNGIVDEVAVVPSSSSYTNIKTYDCMVRIIEEVKQLKPGMTAVVEIHVDRIRNVLSTPVQAVVQRNKETFCYIDNGSGVERRDIKLGRSNDKFVHLLEGVEANDRIVLNPMAILTEATEEYQIAPDSNSSEAPEIPSEELARQQERRDAGKSRSGGKSRESFASPTKQGEARRGGRPGGGSRGGGGRPPGGRGASVEP